MRSDPKLIPLDCPLVSVCSVSKVYAQQTVVDNISFTIQQGECFGVLGPNGAGKTTTLRMLLGHSPVSSGKISVLGFDIPGQAQAMRMKTGIVPQTDNLDLDFTVIQNLLIFGRYFGLTRKQREKRIPELLSFAALEDQGNRKINELSGGMRRRLCIARALINQPELLILDEPTTGLDPQVRHLIWQQLRKLRKNGLTIILTTHYMDEAQRLCDRILLMDRGKILANQSPQDLIAEQIESHVLEVYGDELSKWRETIVFSETTRLETVGEVCFYFGQNLQYLVESLEGWPQLRYAYRPANLEDVFLKMTGRELGDD